jgi:hypothetical protein
VRPQVQPSITKNNQKKKKEEKDASILNWEEVRREGAK